MFDPNRPVQPYRSFKCYVRKDDIKIRYCLYYPLSDNKGPDQLCVGKGPIF